MLFWGCETEISCGGGVCGGDYTMTVFNLYLPACIGLKFSWQGKIWKWNSRWVLKGKEEDWGWGGEEDEKLIS